MFKGEGGFEQLFEHQPNGILMIDATGRIALANHRAEQMFGYKRDQMIGQPVEILIPESARHHHPSLRKKYQKEPVPRDMGHGRDLAAQRADGGVFEVEVGLTPVGDNIIATITDISERKRQERVLNLLLWQLKQAAEEMHRTSNNIASVAEAGLRLAEKGKDAAPFYKDALERIAMMAKSRPELLGIGQPSKEKE